MYMYMYIDIYIYICICVYLHIYMYMSGPPKVNLLIYLQHTRIMETTRRRSLV